MSEAREEGRIPQAGKADLELAARRFEAIFSSAQDAIVCITRQGIVTLYNDAAERIFGWPRPEVVGRNVSMLMPSPYREEHDDYIARFERTGEARAIGRVRSVHGRHKGGNVFPIELSVSAARVGDEVTYAAIVRDVSERESARQAIRVSQARFDAFMEHAPVAACMKDAEGRYLYVNRAFERSFGVPGAEVAGKSDFDLHAREVARSLRAADESVLALQSPKEQVETIPDRHGRPREWLTLRFPVEVDAGRRVLGCMSVEITSQRRIERHLRVQYDVVRHLSVARSFEDALPHVLRAIGEGLGFDVAEYWALAADAESLALAGSWCAGGSADARLESPGSEFRLSRGVGLPGRALAAGRVLVAQDVTEDPTFRRAGQAHAAGLHGGCAFPVRAEGREFGAVTLFLRQTFVADPDLAVLLETLGKQLGEHAERARMEVHVAELKVEASHRARLAELGAVGARLVHDLSNPIAGIVLQVQMLARAAEKEGRPDLQEIAEQVLGSMQNQVKLVASLKEFARAQRLDVADFAAAPFLDEIATQWRPLAAARAVTLEVDAPADAVLHGDRERLRRVLENLIKNAIEAVGEGGRVGVTMQSHGGATRLTVEDDGPGIPAGLDVFGLFATTKPDGSGLGLAITRELVEAHGGSVHFERRPSRGTAFHVDLPARPSTRAGVAAVR